MSFDTHRVPQSAIEALQQVHESGIKIIIATGRAFTDLHELEEIPYDAVIALNGSDCDIDDRYCDEDDEDFANDTVGAQAERDRDHLMSGRNHLTGQGVGIERLLFSCHDLKNSLEVMQN